MARPTKKGLDYFPVDVGFLRDKKVKLLQAEYGASSVVFVLYVFCRAFEEDGYFLKWDKDECLIAADELKESPTYIREVLHGCLARSLFDEGVYQMFGILTSSGIQRRYLRGCEKRDEIEIASEYWLLDKDDKNDVPTSILNKLAFFTVSGGKNEVNSPGNQVNSPGNPQSKVKKSKVKQSKGERDAAASTAGKKEKYGEYGWVRLTPEEYSRMASEFGADTVKKYIQVVDELAQQTGNKNKWKDWNLTVRKAIRNQWGGKPWEQTKDNSKKQRAPSYDLELFEQSLMEETL